MPVNIFSFQQGTGVYSSNRTINKQQNINDYLPILALLFIASLSTTFMGLNQITHKEMEHPIIYAIFCLEVGAVYILYTIISTIAVFAVNCIEHRSGIRSLSPYDRVIEQHIEWGEDDEDMNDDFNDHDHDNIDEKINETSGLVITDHRNQRQQQQPQHNPVSILFARGIHREALISSMYLGGSGCFLALPALSFWNISQTCAFLLSLTAIAFFGEHTKLVEFAPNQDKARVLREMKFMRWLLYFSTTTFIICIMMKDNMDFYLKYRVDLNHINNKTVEVLVSKTSKDSNSIQPVYESGSIIMLILAFVSPMLLRLSLPHAIIRTKSLMSPSQVLEAALPVSCLHAILVLGWYGGATPPMGIDIHTKNLPLFIPMMLICPFCQVIILAFILRGFRQRQSMPTIIILSFAAFIMQQIFGHSKMGSREDWSLFSIGICIIGTSIVLIYTKYQATASVSKKTIGGGSNTKQKKNKNIITSTTTTKQQDDDDDESKVKDENVVLKLDEINLDEDEDEEKGLIH